MANQSKQVGSDDSDAMQSRTIVGEADDEKYHRRTRSVSPSADMSMDSSINVVQNVLNRRQLQVGTFITLYYK